MSRPEETSSENVQPFDQAEGFNNDGFSSEGVETAAFDQPVGPHRLSVADQPVGPHTK